MALSKDPENLDNTNPGGDDFDTLNNEALIDQSAKRANVVGDTSKLSQNIPGANHPGQTINLDAETPISDNGFQQSQQQTQQQNTGGGTYTPPPNQGGEQKFNQEFHELPKEDKEEAALLAADGIIHAYCGIFTAIGSALQISEKQLTKMHNKGEINMYLPVRLNKDTLATIPQKQLVDQYNYSTIAPFETSEEFKENVRPLLAHVLKDKGIALTPEQLLAYYVGLDLLQKGKAAVVALGDKKELITLLRESNEISKKQNVTNNVTPVSPDVPPQQQQSGPISSASSTPQNIYSTDEVKTEVHSQKDVIKGIIANAEKTGGKKVAKKSVGKSKTKRKYTKKTKPSIFAQSTEPNFE